MFLSKDSAEIYLSFIYISASEFLRISRAREIAWSTCAISAFVPLISFMILSMLTDVTLKLYLYPS